MEIIQERLEREYGLTLITTAPTVVYRVTTTKGEVLEIDNPAELPPPGSIERFEEPFILETVITPERYMGRDSPIVPGASRYSAQHPLPRSHARDDQL